MSSISLPTLLQSGEEDVTLPNDLHAVPVWNGLDGQDDIWVQMPAGAHYSFISICTDLEEDLLLSFRPDALDDGCGEDSIPTTDALPVLTAYLRAFANEHVLGLSGWTALIDSEPLSEGFVVQPR